MKPVQLILIVAFTALFVTSGQKATAQNQNKPLTLTTANFDETIKKGVVLVDFWATWCRPCVMQGPIIDEIADSLAGKIKVGKVDTDKNKDLQSRFAIQSIPTTIIFVDGVAVNKAIGLQTKEQILERLKPYLKK